VRVLRAAERVAVPWKNGGGVTREVAIWPPDSTFDDFDWRVSVADVREAGPFSVFENIDRTMTILAGRLGLAIEDRVVELDMHSAPFAFPGDVPCSGTPLGGPVRDLNVMTRRGRCFARAESLSVLPQSDNAVHTLIVASTTSAVDVGEEQISLAALDALLMEGCAAVRLRSGAGFRIVLSAR
jgi:hypothetical protein